MSDRDRLTREYLALLCTDVRGKTREQIAELQRELERAKVALGRAMFG